MGNSSQHHFSADTLNRWYRTQLGRRVVIEERELLVAQLPRLFGYTLLQIGGASLVDALDCSPIQQKVILGDEGSVDCLAEQLPIASDSIDLVILPHAIELSDDPHQLLREVERVLIPEGHLLILGFNPWSLWGLRWLITRNRCQFPWSAQFHSASKLGDWLSLLGFERLHSNYHLFQLPIQRPLSFGGAKSLFARYFPRFGGGYCLLVRKRVSTLTPIKPAWGNRKRVVGMGLNGSAVRRERD
ncbi:MAG: class I SAM-dependent methyltransferase [Gammaproteobacteria bacterium]|nr:class I SAM-dependent methyltransferase [Gammaproteobacteria bacterium]